MLKYQIVTKLAVYLMVMLLNYLILLTLQNTDRIALTSGDSDFLFSTWQGWIIILLFVFMLIFCVSIDINTKIINSANIINESHDSIFASILKGFKSAGNFLSPWGIPVICYISFILPIIGLGYTSSLTDSFTIPPWIYEGFVHQFWWPYAKAAIFAVFAYVGIRYAFTIHFAILGHEKAKTAMKHSAEMVKAHLWDFLLKFVLCTVIGIPLAVKGICWLLSEGPFYLINLSSMNITASRFITILIYMTATLLLIILTLLITPLMVLQLTRLWYQYREEKCAFVPEQRKKHHPLLIISILLIGLIDLGISYIGALSFSAIFINQSNVGIIAHRLGGNLGPENTLLGMQNAAATGVWGNEMDVERTKDGYYIINHDDSFQRVAGLNRKPDDLILAQIKELVVKDSFDKTRPSAAVSTLEEVLAEGKKSGQYLLVELKGRTADKQMADDVVQMIKDQGMENQALIMSLKYKLMEYTESAYPEMNTGYIYSYAYGKQAEIKVDSLILEVTPATSDVIAEIHDQNKQVYVWTVDTNEKLNHFLDSDADGIITNEVTKAEKIQTRLNQRTDQERVRDFFTTMK